MEPVTFADETLPADLKRQILAAHRREWPEGFDPRQPPRDRIQPARYRPLHFLLVERDLLVSYVGVVRTTLTHAGETYRTYGLSGVCTEPAFRRRGHGRNLVDAATDHIRGSDADIGLFSCPPARRGFYAAAGWTPMDDSPLFGGPKGDPRPSGELTMMGFFSDQGKRGKASFAATPIVFGDEIW